MRCLIILPTYNERENLRAIVESIQQHAPGVDVLVVDDNSPDNTGAVADELSREHPERIFVIHRPAKEGLGPAYVAAFKFALARDYDLIFQMDADFSHDPKYLADFFEKIRENDLVVGSRYIKGISVVNWDLKRLILSKAATAYVRFVTRVPFTDATSGFSLWRREALEKIDFEDAFSSGYVFLVEMKYKAWRKGLRVAEVPIIFVERKSGDSKLDWKVIREAVWGVVRLRLKH
jgi:dolichol-phosphate mannosyltransferase